MGVKKHKTNAQVCNALKKAVINSKNKEYHMKVLSHTLNKNRKLRFIIIWSKMKEYHYNTNKDP